MRTSAAPVAHDGNRRSASSSSGAAVAACRARSSRDWSSDDCICIRTVRNTASATSATAKPTAIVVSRITRLASDRR